MKNSIICTLIITLLSLGTLSAKDRDWGKIGASLESKSIYYMKDLKTNAYNPSDKFGMNNYLKVDYSIKGFTIGLQYETYLPALVGYPSNLDGTGIAMKYVAFQNDYMDIRVGDFFQQFGSGMLFRSWEDRSLGINTAIEGLNAGFNYKNIVSVRGIAGRPSLYLDKLSSQVRGLDVSFDALSFLKRGDLSLKLEGSFLNKYEGVKPEDLDNFSENVNGYSARLGFQFANLTIKAENVWRDPNPTYLNDLSKDKGMGTLVEVNYDGPTYGSSLIFRRLKRMESYTTRKGNTLYENLNYLPALTQQSNYTLFNRTPYSSQAFDEIGGQADIFWSWKRKLKLHANFSTWYGDPKASSDNSNTELLYRNLAVDGEIKWNSKYKTIIAYSYQVFNPAIKGYNSDQWTSHAFAADMLFKINNTNYIRAELQYLMTNKDKKSWVGASVEYSLAPNFTFSAADWWNFGGDGTHYYNVGVGYTRNKVRGMLSYGRFMEGYICSGGVCSYIPAYTGLNLTLNVTL